MPPIALGLGLSPSFGGAGAAFDPLSLNPLAWWPFDDGSGSTARDASGGGADLTLFNSPTWIADGPGGGKALTFNGGNFTVGTTSAATLLAALQSRSVFTVVFWARTAAYQSNGVGVAIDQDVSTNLFELDPYISTPSGPRVNFNGSVIINSSDAISLDAWHMFAFVAGGATDHNLLVDAASVGIDTTSETIGATVGFVAVGALVTAAQGFTGDMANVFIFPTALTAGQIAALDAWGS